MMTSALRDVYESLWPRIASLPTDQGLSLPLFLSLPDSDAAAGLRLLVVGQETYSWYGLLGQDLGEDPVGRILGCYSSFNLGAGYRSPFWDATRQLCRLLGTPGNTVDLAWSNLYPCDQRKRRPAVQLRQTLHDLRQLPREVAVLKPEAIVFFTGPRYDDALTSLFPASRFIAPEAPCGHWIHRVEHPDLPAASYRLYHPAYLRRRRMGGAIDTVASLIRGTVALSGNGVRR